MSSNQNGNSSGEWLQGFFVGLLFALLISIFVKVLLPGTISETEVCPTLMVMPESVRCQTFVSESKVNETDIKLTQGDFIRLRVFGKVVFTDAENIELTNFSGNPVDRTKILPSGEYFLRATANTEVTLKPLESGTKFYYEHSKIEEDR